MSNFIYFSKVKKETSSGHYYGRVFLPVASILFTIFFSFPDNISIMLSIFAIFSPLFQFWLLPSHYYFLPFICWQEFAWTLSDIVMRLVVPELAIDCCFRCVQFESNIYVSDGNNGRIIHGTTWNYGELHFMITNIYIYNIKPSRVSVTIVFGIFRKRWKRGGGERTYGHTDISSTHGYWVTLYSMSIIWESIASLEIRAQLTNSICNPISIVN